MKVFKRIVRILLILILLVGVVSAFILLPKQKCEQIKTVASTENESLLVGQADIEKMLAEADCKIVGEIKKDVDLTKIASVIKKNPFIESVDFVHFSGKTLVIDYTLRKILLNVFTQDGENYFVDENGVIVPFSNRMEDCLMIVNGNISNEHKIGKLASKNVIEALKITKVINNDDFNKAQYRQIHINKNKEPELMSTIGGQVILLGNADDINEKLENLKTLYEKGFPHKGYHTYSMLDARYKNRIIGTKNN